MGPPPEPSGAGRVGRGGARERARDSRLRESRVVPSKADFAPTKEQGISRLLTINLNDVEKELHIK